MTDPVDMVERKLSGVYLRREIEIPYAWFDNYVANIVEVLQNNGVMKDPAEVANRPEVIAQFDKELEEAIEDWTTDPTDTIGDPWALTELLYNQEIEAKRVEHQLALSRAVAQATEENYLDKAIPVRPRHRAEAIEVLRKAGLFDEFFASHISGKLEEKYGPKE
jgi:hypothetical protein